MPDETPSDFPLRGGVLPWGCKDLLDVIKMAESEQGRTAAEGMWEKIAKAMREAQEMAKAMKDVPTGILEEMAKAALEELEKSQSAKIKKTVPPAAVPRVIEIGTEITVRELAERMCLPPHTIILVLISMKVFVANADKVISFEVAAEVGRRTGFEVKREGG
jgi:hypothetical protein